MTLFRGTVPIWEFESLGFVYNRLYNIQIMLLASHLCVFFLSLDVCEEAEVR